MSLKEVSMEDGVVEFLRAEIRERYALDRMRARPEFAGVPDEILVQVRDFILDRIYLPLDVRRALDPSFAALGLLLRSPKRMGVLLRSTWASVLRLGPHLPAAVSAGIATVDAFFETARLEKAMLAAARDLDLRPEDLWNRTRMLQMVGRVPQERVQSLLNDVTRLLEALADSKMLAGILRVLDRCLATMHARKDTFSPLECQGMAFARDVLDNGYHLFKRITPADLPRIIKGIKDIEADWYAAAHRVAARN